ncbi:MAG: alpha amylase N-terminal ig-like domain-containing protein, partial [Anaerolineae bacterium]|nr:alpha amylase N-terminal ig-like domain-containing protein [Anaerolineae bacterium]
MFKRLFKQIVTLVGLSVLVVSLLPLVNLAAQADDGINPAALLHDSRDDLYRVPGGAVPVGTNVKLRFRTAAGDVDEVLVRLWNAVEGEQALLPMDVVATTPDGYDLWELTLNTGRKPTVLWYRFLVNKGGETLYYEDDTRLDEGTGNLIASREGGPGTVYTQSPDLSYQITVYDPAFTTPEWMRNAVIYQIFPDRFRDGDLSNDPVDGTVLFYGSNPLIFHETWNEPPVDPREEGPYQNQWNQDFFGGDLAGITEELDYLQALGVTAIYLNPI